MKSTKVKKRAVRKVKTVPKPKRISRLVKKCHAAWSLAVRTRDGACLLCSSESSLAAHHWIVSATRCRRHRFTLANGVTLCYGCHIHKIHKEASYANALDLYVAARDKIGEDEIRRVLDDRHGDSPLFKEEVLKETLARLEAYTELRLSGSE